MDKAAKEKNSGKTDKEVADILSQQGFKLTEIDTAVNQSQHTNKQGDDPFLMGEVSDEKNEPVAAPEQPLPEATPPPEDDMALEPPSPEDYEAELKGEPKPDEAAPAPEAMPEVQATQQQPQGQFDQAQSAMGSQEMIHQIAEKVVYEKWDELMGNIGDIVVWKNSMERDMKSVKQEILRVSARLDNVQNSVLGKVREYGEGLSTIGSEIQALEGVLSKILDPLTENIKELNKITNKLKK